MKSPPGTRPSIALVLSILGLTAAGCSPSTTPSGADSAMDVDLAQPRDLAATPDTSAPADLVERLADLLLPAKGAVGEPCAVAADCEGGACLPFPGGYCSRVDCVVPGCPTGSVCFAIGAGSSACFKTCASALDCRAAEGYVCDADKTCYSMAVAPVDMAMMGARD